jgi:poly(A) polymerase
MTNAEIFKTIYNISEELKTKIYIVGGFVRDELLQKEYKKDLDFVVEGSGIAFANKFAEILGEERASLIPFADFDTARIVIKNEEGVGIVELEFAGARSETYEEHSRKPKVTATTLEQDLSRRDFTVNAMARQVLEGGELGVLLDPFSGEHDLKNKIIKTPLDPNVTFSDDPLRMMRAARFAAQLEFDIEDTTYAAIVANRERLKIISAERTTEELFKLLKSRVPSVGLWILYETGLFDEFLPEVRELAGVEEVYGYTHKDNLSHTFAVVDNLAQYSSDPLLRYAALMHDIAKPDTKEFVPGRGWTFDMHDHLGKKMVRDIGRRLRMSKKDTDYVAKLVRWHLQPIALMDEEITDSAVRRLIVNLGDDLKALLILCRSDITTGNQKKRERRLQNYDILEKRIEEIHEKDRLRAFQSPLRGEEIMELCGLKPGPTIGRIKEALEEAILEGIIPNEYEATKEYFFKIKDEFLAGAGDWEKK